jgi:hypothetical protein
MKTAYDYEREFFKHHWRQNWTEFGKGILLWGLWLYSVPVILILIYGEVDIGEGETMTALDFMRTSAILVSLLAIVFLFHWRKWKKQMSVERARWWKHLESTQGEQKF